MLGDLDIRIEITRDKGPCPACGGRGREEDGPCGECLGRRRVGTVLSHRHQVSSSDAATPGYLSVVLWRLVAGLCREGADRGWWPRDNAAARLAAHTGR